MEPTVIIALAIAAALLPVKALEAKRGLARSRALAKCGFCKAEHATGRGRDDDLEAAVIAARVAMEVTAK